MHRLREAISIALEVDDRFARLQACWIHAEHELCLTTSCHVRRVLDQSRTRTSLARSARTSHRSARDPGRWPPQTGTRAIRANTHLHEPVQPFDVVGRIRVDQRGTAARQRPCLGAPLQRGAQQAQPSPASKASRPTWPKPTHASLRGVPEVRCPSPVRRDAIVWRSKRFRNSRRQSNRQTLDATVRGRAWSLRVAVL